MPEGWLARLRTVWPYATFAATVCFLTSGSIGGFVAWRGGADGLLSFLLVMLYPALATLFFLLVCVLCPTVFVGPRYGALHSFTIPTIYLSLVYAAVSLSRDSASSVQRIQGAARTDLIWLDLTLIVQAWMVMVVVFFAIGALSARPKPEEP